jgi:hypothetical protein
MAGFEVIIYGRFWVITEAEIEEIAKRYICPVTALSS